MRNAGSIEYSVQEQIEEENSDPDEEDDDDSDFERGALENDMSPKKQHYSRQRGSGSSSAEAKSSSSEQSRMTSGFAPPAGVDQGTGVEEGIEA